MDSESIGRFWTKVNKRGPTQDHMNDRCWEWTGAKNADGYGRFSSKGKDWLAHRFSFLLLTGQSPEQVLHKCDNRACVRPNHLGAGDNEMNLIDILVRKLREAREERDLT